MAEIIPQGTIILFRDVPLSPDYNNTFWFQTQAVQASHFQTTYQSVRFENQSYQRKNRGWVRLKAPYKDVFNTNYMMFRNNYAVNLAGETVRNQYEQKWWYAFIDTVEYVNDNVSDIHYTIDVIQSYMFDIQYENTMVERLTVANDTPGANMIDEGLPVGDYVFENAQPMKFRQTISDSGEYKLLTEMRPVIAATCDEKYKDTTDGASITTTISHNIVIGCKMIDPLKLEPALTAKEWLDNLPGEKQNAILGIQMMPSVIANAENGNYNFVSEPVNPPASLGAYHPFNKKLLTYPFNACYVVNSDGASQIYDYYLLGKNVAGHRAFLLYCAYTFPLQAVLRPVSYKGNADARPTYAMSLPSLPTCTWSNDTWKAWAAMNTGYTAISIASSAIDAGVRIASAFVPGSSTVLGGGYAEVLGGFASSGATAFGSNLPSTAVMPNNTGLDFTAQAPFQITGNSSAHLDTNTLSRNAGGLTNDLINITRNIISIHNAKIVPDSFNGSAQGLASIVGGTYGFFIAQRCIRADYAQQIDDYFTMFGYKILSINQLTHSSLHLRSRFTYIKTANMDIRGNIPADDRSQICSIFDKGVRFWCEYTDVGNYDMTAKPNNPI